MPLQLLEGYFNYTRDTFHRKSAIPRTFIKYRRPIKYVLKNTLVIIFNIIVDNISVLNIVVFDMR